MSLARAVLVVGLLVACKRPAPEITPPTRAEADAFATEFAKHVLPCNMQALLDDLDSATMVERALAGRRISDDEARAFRLGIGNTLANTLCESVKSVGVSATYRLLHVREIDGQPRPLFRVVGDDGLTYHELVLDKQERGIRAVDVKLYTTGETFSEIIGSILDTVESPRDAEPMTDAKAKLAAGDYAGARAALERLPESMRKTKSWMMFDVGAAQRQGDAEYLAAIERFSAQYPDDPTIDLVRIDAMFMRKDYKRGLEIVDSLDKQLGGDPYLDVQRVSLLVSAGDLAKAVVHGKRAIERAPELVQSWWALLTAQLAAKQFMPALATIDRYNSKFAEKIVVAELGGDQRFTELLASPEYKATLAK